MADQVIFGQTNAVAKPTHLIPLKDTIPPNQPNNVVQNAQVFHLIHGEIGQFRPAPTFRRTIAKKEKTRKRTKKLRKWQGMSTGFPSSALNCFEGRLKGSRKFEKARKESEKEGKRERKRERTGMLKESEKGQAC